MRRCITLFAILLALIAFSPTQTMAKGPGGGGGGGNRPSGVHAGGNAQGGNHHAGADGGAGINLGVRSNPGGPGNQGIGNQGIGNQGIGNQGMVPGQGFEARSRPEFSGSREGGDSWRYRWDNGRWWFWGPGDRWMWYGDDGRWLDYGNAYVVKRPIVNDFSGGPIKIVNPAESGVTLNYLLDGNSFTIPPGYNQDLREDRAWVIQFSRGANLDQARYGLQSGVYTFAHTDHGWELYRSEFPQTVAPAPPMAARTNPSPQ